VHGVVSRISLSESADDEEAIDLSRLDRPPAGSS
jgi:hypothetical protein